ncbi:UPF0187-domain-containing protein [Laetiporus sulphureus 93-53]|uniref:UPF0187-domain-containing protein n=1 Tax=Laetiporus sulphureus 93-53 TaxID=1314785 RepID=A0A165CTA5_9APHY|nr:UPF0187-domain-containing protein [Laetiporus sulphureus 93-53]KZT03398.1 UPF0187-domain-containing protein [Laetiporus sulphureus 93-53]
MEASITTTTSTKPPNVTILISKEKIISRQRLRKYSWLPDVLRVKGSIVPRIIGPVLTVTIFASLAAYLWDRGTDVALTNQVVPLLSVVVGLILVFRNGTSYDRYYEGRKDFASMVSHIRSFSRLIWVNIAVPPADDSSKGKGPQAQLTTAQLRRRKVDALRLCIAFSYAVKHYLRGEDGLGWEDYAGVIPASVVRLAQSGGSSRRTSAYVSYGASGATSPTESESGREQSPARILEVDATKRVRVKRSKDKLRQPGQKTSKTPLLSALHQTIDFNEHPEQLSTPLPLIIAHELSRAIFLFKRDGYLETVGPAGTNALSAHVQGMVDMMTAMERVANTPIPRSYSIHLKQCVTLYLFVLPFTLIKELGWGMVPIVTVVAFTLMGIEGIADEIEMPFGLGKSDLPLDRYCEDLKEEIEYIVERLPEGGQGMYGIDDGEGDD